MSLLLTICLIIDLIIISILTTGFYFIYPLGAKSAAWPFLKWDMIAIFAAALLAFAIIKL